MRNADCGHLSVFAVCDVRKMLDLQDVESPSHNLNTFANCVQVNFQLQVMNDSELKLRTSEKLQLWSEL
jgi:hypothetical protein